MLETHADEHAARSNAQRNRLYSVLRLGSHLPSLDQPRLSLCHVLSQRSAQDMNRAFNVSQRRSNRWHQAKFLLPDPRRKGIGVCSECRLLSIEVLHVAIPLIIYRILLSVLLSSGEQSPS